MRSSTLRSVAREMFRARDGLRSQEKRIRSAARSSARITSASSLPRPSRVRGSSRGRRCATVSHHHQTGVAGQIAEFAERAVEGRFGVPRRPPGWRGPRTAGRGVRAPAGRSRVRDRRPVRRSRAASGWGETGSSSCQGCSSGPRSSPGRTGGRRWAAWTSPGSPSEPTVSAAIRSSRSNTRSARSSRLSGSPARWVCTSRRAAQPRAGDALAPQVGEFDPVRIADPDPGRRAAPIEEDADLTPDVPGHAGEPAGELLREEGRRREPRLGQPFRARAGHGTSAPTVSPSTRKGTRRPRRLCAESPRAGTLSAGSPGSDQCEP